MQGEEQQWAKPGAASGRDMVGCEQIVVLAVRRGRRGHIDIVLRQNDVANLT